MAESNGNIEASAEKTTDKATGKSLVKMFLIFGIVMVLLQIGMVQMAIRQFSPAARKEQSEPKEEKIKEEKKKEKKKSEKDIESIIGRIYAINEIIVNPARTEGRRFLNVSVAFQFSDAIVGTELEKRNIQVRDVLISILTSKPVDAIDDAEEKDQLRQEILTNVNALLTTGKVEKVYFSNFVMQ